MMQKKSNPINLSDFSRAPPLRHVKPLGIERKDLPGEIGCACSGEKSIDAPSYTARVILAKINGFSTGRMTLEPEMMIN